ncbi:MAG: hypothetical protein M3P50_13280, partial [Actinomycetota bacterium]|nr:hypothetical protein [Actinomycetota bacterium]
PGARRVRIEVRAALAAKAGGRTRRSRPALRLSAPVSADGRFSLTFRAGTLARGLYRVTLDSGRGSEPWLKLAVR